MNPAGNPWPPIGKLFVDRGRVSPAEFEDALAEQSRTGERIGEILVRRGRITRIELADALSTQWSWKSTAPAPSAELPVAPALRAGARDAGEQLAAGEARLAALESRVAELTKVCAALMSRVDAQTKAIEHLHGVTVEQARRIAVAGTAPLAEPRPTGRATDVAVVPETAPHDAGAQPREPVATGGIQLRTAAGEHHPAAPEIHPNIEVANRY